MTTALEIVTVLEIVTALDIVTLERVKQRACVSPRRSLTMISIIEGQIRSSLQ